jgi:hypothetical protein
LKFLLSLGGRTAIGEESATRPENKQPSTCGRQRNLRTLVEADGFRSRVKIRRSTKNISFRAPLFEFRAGSSSPQGNRGTRGHSSSRRKATLSSQILPGPQLNRASLRQLAYRKAAERTIPQLSRRIGQLATAFSQKDALTISAMRDARLRDRNLL